MQAIWRMRNGKAVPYASRLRARGATSPSRFPDGQLSTQTADVSCRTRSALLGDATSPTKQRRRFRGNPVTRASNPAFCKRTFGGEEATILPTKRRVVAFLGAAACLPACTPLDPLNALDTLTPGGDARKLVDGAAYGPYPRQRLDLYAPARPAAPRPYSFFSTAAAGPADAGRIIALLQKPSPHAVSSSPCRTTVSSRKCAFPSSSRTARRRFGGCATTPGPMAEIPAA